MHAINRETARGGPLRAQHGDNSETLTSLQMLEKARDGRIFVVEFIKRTDGSIRRMICRRGVHKDIKGTGMSYDPTSKALLTVWDIEAAGYRMINLADLVSLSMGSKKYIWNGRRFDRVV